MSFETMMVTPVTIRRPGAGTDRYGDTGPDWTSATDVDTTGWLAQLDDGEDFANRDAYTSTWRLFLRPAETLSAGDRVISDGVTFEVDGPPQHARTPTGIHHIEATLRAVVG